MNISSSNELAELLARHGVIQAEAVECPEDYDGYDTVNRIENAWQEMTRVEQPDPLAGHPELGL